MSTEETEPKGSASSSPDDLFAPGAEAYYRKVLKLDEPKDTLPRGGAEGSGGHVHEWGTWECIGLDRAEVWIRRCLCGASQSRSEKPQELCGSCDAGLPMSCTCPQEPGCQARWIKTGLADLHCDQRAGHPGLHLSGLTDFQWTDEKAIYPEAVPCEHVPHFGPWFQQSDGKWRQVSICELCKVTLPGTHAVHDPCTHCQGPHALEDCKGLEEPETERCCSCGSADVVYRNYREQPFCEHCSNCTCGQKPCVYTPPAAIPRRPPYAVAYAVEGGAQYEVAVSGDATVVAEDGALHILHPKKPVLAIVRIQPMNMEESDG